MATVLTMPETRDSGFQTEEIPEKQESVVGLPEQAQQGNEVAAGEDEELDFDDFDEDDFDDEFDDDFEEEAEDEYDVVEEFEDDFVFVDPAEKKAEEDPQGDDEAGGVLQILRSMVSSQSSTYRRRA